MKKNMTVKLKEKQQAMTVRLQKKEQAETSELVSKHSAQMLELLKQKQDELRQELMVSDGILDDYGTGVNLFQIIFTINI